MSAPVVVDASVVVRFLLGGDGDERARASTFLLDSEDLAAPTVFWTEVLGRISGQMKAGGSARLSEAAASQMLAVLDRLDVELYAPQPAVDGPRLLPLGGNLSIPDASYVLLAEQLGTHVVTLDARMINGAAKRGVGQLVREP